MDEMSAYEGMGDSIVPSPWKVQHTTTPVDNYSFRYR
jgi:hypothetical protein